MYCRTGEIGSSVTVIGGDKADLLAKVMTIIVTKNTVMIVVGRVMTVRRTSMIMTAQSQGSSL